jgi:hypothetical protein
MKFIQAFSKKFKINFSLYFFFRFFFVLILESLQRRYLIVLFKMENRLLILIFYIISFNLLQIESSLFSFFRDKKFFIEEGTKWCGGGNIADSCNDLGIKNETDSCCREHDHCPYTYTSDNVEFLGYSWNGFSTLSHCECDIRFNDCLSEEPIKFGSEYVKSVFFTGLKVRCFMFLACDPNEEEKEHVWFRKGLRRIGKCVNGIKVRVFHSIEEYQSYVNTRLDMNDKLAVKEILSRKPFEIMTERKLNAKCFDDFKHYNSLIVDLFVNRFIEVKMHTTTHQESTTSIISTSTLNSTLIPSILIPKMVNKKAIETSRSVSFNSLDDKIKGLSTSIRLFSIFSILFLIVLFLILQKW